MELVIKTTKKDQVVDITEGIQSVIDKNNWQIGLVHLFLLHTTCALTTADLDPGTDLDMLDAFRTMMPKLKYRHPHDPAHVPDHLLSALIGTSLLLPVENRKLILGTWQRVVLIEFNGPRERNLKINFINQSSAAINFK